MTAYDACPLCGLRGCASPVAGAEVVSPDLLSQVRNALAVTTLPEVAPEIAVPAQRTVQWLRRADAALAELAPAAEPSPAVAGG